MYSTRAATVTVTYVDTLKESGREESCCHSLSYPPLSDYLQKSQYLWRYVYSTRTATVTMTYVDTLTEQGRGMSGSTCTVHVPPELL